MKLTSSKYIRLARQRILGAHIECIVLSSDNRSPWSMFALITFFVVESVQICRIVGYVHITCRNVMPNEYIQIYREKTLFRKFFEQVGVTIHLFYI